MTLPRHQLISLDETPYYHCISRCVRRAYLCGDDPVSGENFDHRKVWLVEKMKALAATFAIDICAYAVMSNHYHLVLHVNDTEAAGWTQEEVIARWTRLFSRNARMLETLDLNQANRSAQRKLTQTVALWRERLTDISWFMRCLNEAIARRANREDQCSGRFWEGRFRSQALLDEKALVTCMAYVDLNPVRAGICDNPMESDFTSIQERLVSYARRVKNKNRQQRTLVKHYHDYFEKHKNPKQPGSRLMLMNNNNRDGLSDMIPISQQDYFSLIDWSVEQITGKTMAGHQNRKLRARQVIDNLAVESSQWINAVTGFEKHFGLVAGSAESLVRLQAKRAVNDQVKHEKKWIRGKASAIRFFSS